MSTDRTSILETGMSHDTGRSEALRPTVSRGYRRGLVIGALTGLTFASLSVPVAVDYFSTRAFGYSIYFDTQKGLLSNFFSLFSPSRSAIPTSNVPTVQALEPTPFPTLPPTREPTPSPTPLPEVDLKQQEAIKQSLLQRLSRMVNDFEATKGTLNHYAVESRSKLPADSDMLQAPRFSTTNIFKALYNNDFGLVSGSFPVNEVKQRLIGTHELIDFPLQFEEIDGALEGLTFIIKTKKTDGSWDSNYFVVIGRSKSRGNHIVVNSNEGPRILRELIPDPSVDFAVVAPGNNQPPTPAPQVWQATAAPTAVATAATTPAPTSPPPTHTPQPAQAKPTAPAQPTSPAQPSATPAASRKP